MEKIVVKRLINGKFQEVKSYSVYEVQKIRHREFGLEIVLNGRTRLYCKQCEIEFK